VATNIEQIQELNKLVTMLGGKIEVLQELKQEVKLLTADVQQQGRDIAALKQSSTHMDKQLDQLIHQRFTIWVALASAVFGSLLTFGSQP
jgi:hypothetical protein